MIKLILQFLQSFLIMICALSNPFKITDPFWMNVVCFLFGTLAVSSFEMEYQIFKTYKNKKK